MEIVRNESYICQIFALHVWGSGTYMYLILGHIRVQIPNDISVGLTVFSEHAVARLSFVCLSVTLVHPTQALVIFRNISTAFGTLTII